MYDWPPSGDVYHRMDPSMTTANSPSGGRQRGPLPLPVPIYHPPAAAFVTIGRVVLVSLCIPRVRARLIANPRAAGVQSAGQAGVPLGDDGLYHIARP